MMRPSLLAVAVAALLSSSADAAFWKAPKPTPAVAALASQVSKYNAPRTTMAPYAPYDALGRRAEEAITAIEAADNTCGYFGGRSGD